MLCNYILTFRTNVLCNLVVGGLCDSLSSHPREQYRFPVLLAHSPYHSDCDPWHQKFCRGFSVAILGPRRSPCVCVVCCMPRGAGVCSACRGFHAGMPTSCRSSYLCVHAHLFHIVHGNPPSTCVLSGHWVYCYFGEYFSGNTLLVVHRMLVYYVVYPFLYPRRRPLLFMRLFLGMSSATVDDLWWIPIICFSPLIFFFFKIFLTHQLTSGLGRLTVTVYRSHTIRHAHTQ